MNKSIFLTLALVGVCGLQACNRVEPEPETTAEPDVFETAAPGREINMDPVTGEIIPPVEVAAPQPEPEPNPVPEQYDMAGGIMKVRDLGRVGNCNFNEVIYNERRYLLTQPYIYNSEDRDIVCNLQPTQ